MGLINSLYEGAKNIAWRAAGAGAVVGALAAPVAAEPLKKLDKLFSYDRRPRTSIDSPRLSEQSYTRLEPRVRAVAAGGPDPNKGGFNRVFLANTHLTRGERDNINLAEAWIEGELGDDELSLRARHYRMGGESLPDVGAKVTLGFGSSALRLFGNLAQLGPHTDYVSGTLEAGLDKDTFIIGGTAERISTETPGGDISTKIVGGYFGTDGRVLLRFGGGAVTSTDFRREQHDAAYGQGALGVEFVPKRFFIGAGGLYHENAEGPPLRRATGTLHAGFTEDITLSAYGISDLNTAHIADAALIWKPQIDVQQARNLLGVNNSGLNQLTLLPPERLRASDFNPFPIYFQGGVVLAGRHQARDGSETGNILLAGNIPINDDKTWFAHVHGGYDRTFIDDQNTDDLEGWTLGAGLIGPGLYALVSGRFTHQTPEYMIFVGLDVAQF